MSDKTKVYVFCNSCAPRWHSFVAIAEDGRGLAGHLCSDHRFGYHDMGLGNSTWKHEIYDKYLGEDRWELVWLDPEEKPEDLALIKALPDPPPAWPPEEQPEVRS